MGASANPLAALWRGRPQWPVAFRDVDALRMFQEATQHKLYCTKYNNWMMAAYLQRAG